MKRILTGQVLAVLVAPDSESLISVRQERVPVTFAGFTGDRHSGETMPSGSRTPYYPRGTEIRNTRQISVVSLEDLAETAAAMGLPELPPEWLGANLLVQGIPALSLLPPATRLFFPDRTVLVVEGENHPCTTAGAAIQSQVPGREGLADLFPKAGAHRRGVVAWVERGGEICAGDRIRAMLPDQLPYPG